MRSQVCLAGVQNVPQPLVGAVCDGRVDHEHQTGFQTPPQTGVSVLALDHFPPRRQDALLLALGLRLLPRRHDRDRDGEQLSQRARDGSQTQLHGRAGRLAVRLDFVEVDAAHGRVPVEIGEVGARDAEQAAHHAAVQAGDALIVQDVLDCVQSAFVVRVICGIARSGARLRFDLDLQAGFDDVERVDEGVGQDGAGGSGYGQAPWWDFILGEGGHVGVCPGFNERSGGRKCLLFPETDILWLLLCMADLIESRYEWRVRSSSSRLKR